MVRLTKLMYASENSFWLNARPDPEAANNGLAMLDEIGAGDGAVWTWTSPTRSGVFVRSSASAPTTYEIRYGKQRKTIYQYFKDQKDLTALWKLVGSLAEAGGKSKTPTNK